MCRLQSTNDPIKRWKNAKSHAEYEATAAKREFRWWNKAARCPLKLTSRGCRSKVRRKRFKELDHLGLAKRVSRIQLLVQRDHGRNSMYTIPRAKLTVNLSDLLAYIIDSSSLAQLSLHCRDAVKLRDYRKYEARIYRTSSVYNCVLLRSLFQASLRLFTLLWTSSF